MKETLGYNDELEDVIRKIREKRINDFSSKLWKSGFAKAIEEYLKNKGNTEKNKGNTESKQ